MAEKAKYQVLARRYRPQRFSDVVGQEAVLQTLKNGIQRDSVAHAYLFSGSRGVGKTTLARLFAKALNCAALTPSGEPCNQCPSCLDISSAQSLDVIEIDGASNRGIDDIRQINETVGFAPSFGKYKIYIIDEVHMLTKEAFNALLKTLEEPPERAKFFFATTEAHKVLPTILSRCQRFDLGRLLPSQIIAKLESIGADLARSVEPEALHLIARAADGSLRDAESLFDQILCFSNGAVTAADARSVLGLASDELFFSFDRAFAESRLSYAFEIVAHLFQAGKDLGHFLEQLIEHFRNLAVCKTMSVQALQMPQELSAKYSASAALYTQQQCLGALDILLKTDVHLSRSTSPRTSLELALLQILRTKNRIPIEALVRRLSDLEESLLQGAPKELAVEAPVPTVAPAPVVPEPILETPTPIPAPQQPILEIRVPAMAPASAVPEPVLETPAPIPAPQFAIEPPTPIPIPPVAVAPQPLFETPAPAIAPVEPQPVLETPAPVPAPQFAIEPPAPVPIPPVAVAPQPLFETPSPVTALVAPQPVLETPAPVPIPPTAVAPQPPLIPPQEFKEVPFNPYRLVEKAPEVVQPSPPPQQPSAQSKHPSHYDTLIRFAAVELEGTVKN